MDFTDRTYSFIQQSRMLRQKGSVTVGISGGADSVCLFLQLLKLRDRLGISLRAVTVEHGIRGDESIHDAEYSHSLCEKYGVECEVVHVDAPGRAEERGISLEEAARQLRYEAFFKNTARGDYIALAHHMEDQAETVLFHMIRGSGVRGLIGMSPISEVQGRYIIRPLLFATKDEIISELDAAGVSYCTDSTNADTEYSRNRIRSVVMPQLCSINKGAVRHICESAESVGELYDRFFEDEQDVLKRAFISGDRPEDNRLRIDEIKMLDDTARRLIIMEYLRQTLRSIKDVSREHLNRLSDLITKNTHFTYNLPKGAVISLEYGILGVSYDAKEHSETGSSIAITPDNGQLDAFGYSFDISVFRPDGPYSGIPSKNYEKWFDYDKIKKNLCLRIGQDQDYFVIDSCGHTKTFKKYCRDEKIPRQDREKIPILVTGDSHIVWAVGYRISEDVKVTPETRQILVVRAAEHNS